ncbi:MAG: O-antigen ligase family protein [Candidatus Eisenbacteria bacterium]
MTTGPPLPSATAVDRARDSARRQARTLSSGLVMVLGIAAAVFAVVIFAVLDYGFDQDPHRLFKLTLGAALLASILLKPRLGLFVVPLAAPFILWLPKLPLPGLNTLNILIGSVFFSFAMVRLLRREPIFRNGAVGSRLMLLLLVCGLWIFRGAGFPTGYEYNPAAAGLELFRTTMTFCVFFITLAMTRGERERRWMAWAVVLGVLAEGLVTIWLGRNYRGRASGSIAQPNDLAAYFAMFTPLCAALIFAVRNLWARLALVLAVVVGSVGVVLTISRGGILAFAIAMGLVSLRSSRALSILLVVALLASPAWAPDFLKERIVGTQIEDENSDEKELEGSSADRVETWRTIGNLVANHPIEGVGFGGLGYVLSSISTTLPTDIKDSAHNTYLRYLGEMGLVGLGLFLWLLWTCWSLAETGRRRARLAFDRQLALGFGAAALAMAVSCMFGDRFAQVTIGGNFWVLAALVTDMVQERGADPA